MNKPWSLTWDMRYSLSCSVKILDGDTEKAILEIMSTFDFEKVHDHFDVRI